MKLITDKSLYGTWFGLFLNPVAFDLIFQFATVAL